MSKVSTLRPAAGTGTVIIRTGKYNASSAPSSKPVMLARRPGRLLNFLCPGLTACEQRLIGAKMGQRPTLRSDGLWSISKISTNKPRWTRTGIRCSPWRNSHQSAQRAVLETFRHSISEQWGAANWRRRHDLGMTFLTATNEIIMKASCECRERLSMRPLGYIRSYRGFNSRNLTLKIQADWPLGVGYAPAALDFTIWMDRDGRPT